MDAFFEHHQNSIRAVNPGSSEPFRFPSTAIDRNC